MQTIITVRERIPPSSPDEQAGTDIIQVELPDWINYQMEEKIWSVLTFCSQQRDASAVRVLLELLGMFRLPASRGALKHWSLAILDLIQERKLAGLPECGEGSTDAAAYVYRCVLPPDHNPEVHTGLRNGLIRFW